LVGAGGSAINVNPITDIPNNGSESKIITPSGNEIKAAGGGRGGTRYSSTATVYRNGESGGGGAAYANATSSVGPNNTTGGAGKANYGGGGAGADGNGGGGGVETGSTLLGGSADNYKMLTNWIFIGAGFVRAAGFLLGSGGCGSGYVSATVGLGNYNSSPIQGDAGRRSRNSAQYFGQDGNHLITQPASGIDWFGSGEFFYHVAGHGGGGGAFGTANGTQGSTWRGGGNGSRGCVLLRWK
jgi:hypothetical protein